MLIESPTHLYVSICPSHLATRSTGCIASPTPSLTCQWWWCNTYMMQVGRLLYSGIPLIQPPLGPIKVSWLEGWPYFKGRLALRSIATWDILKWPQLLGGGLISGVQIRGSSLYLYITCLMKSAAFDLHSIQYVVATPMGGTSHDVKCFWKHYKNAYK